MSSPPAALEIAEHAEKKSSRVPPKVSLFSASSASSAVKIFFFKIADFV
jgi:hypothetical protein